MEWRKIELPSKLIGDEVVSGKGRYEVRSIEVFLPRKGQYAGYMFFYPSKLISLNREENRAELTYGDEFTFKLVKRNRQAGKRYMRYEISVKEFLEIYQPLEEKLHTMDKKREDEEARQKGNVVLCESAGLNGLHFLEVCFQAEKAVFGMHGEIPTDMGYAVRDVIVEGIRRSDYMAQADTNIRAANRELSVIAHVLDSLGGASDAEHAPYMKKQFLDLCEDGIKQVSLNVHASFLKENEGELL